MSKRPLRALGWLLVAALALAPFVAPRPGDPHGPTSALGRVFGPLAPTLARVQWVRVDAAIRAGRTDLALSRAETAFEFDPGWTEAWTALSSHLAIDLTSPERENDAQQRANWLRAGLEIARRGERTAREPAELAVWQGLLLARAATVDPGLPWPGGEAGLWSAAAECFERAALAGQSEAPVLAARARQVLGALAPR